MLVSTVVESRKIANGLVWIATAVCARITFTSENPDNVSPQIADLTSTHLHQTTARASIKASRQQIHAQRQSYYRSQGERQVQ
jgi:hypothetical protein